MISTKSKQYLSRETDRIIVHVITDGVISRRATQWLELSVISVCGALNVVLGVFLCYYLMGLCGIYLVRYGAILIEYRYCISQA